MPRFSTGEFISSTATNSTHYPNTIMNNDLTIPRITITLPLGELRLPICPPSPLFMGIIEDINTDAFPDFKDINNLDIMEKAEPQHCVIHCKHKICNLIVVREQRVAGQKAFPSCRCVDEEMASGQDPSTPSRPKTQLNTMILEDAYEIRKETEQDETVEVHLQDVYVLLKGFKQIADTRATEWLAPRLRQRFPTQAEAAASGLIDNLFDDLRRYFTETLGKSGPRFLSVGQLEQELCFYGRHGTFLLDRARDLPVEAEDFFYQCVDYLIGLLIWHDRAVQQIEYDQELDMFVACWVLGFLATVVVSVVIVASV